MKTTRLSFVLATLLLVLLGMALVVRRDLSQLNWQFLAAMKHSPAYQAFEVSTDFNNGRTLQSPVAGTIPRGDLPLHYAATKEDALRAGEELLNPYVPAVAEVSPAESGEQAVDAQMEAATSDQPSEVAAETLAESPTAERDPQVELQESISRGADLFRIYCAACHGPTGLGDGLVAQRGFPPPPPLPTGNSTRMKDGQLFHILTYGQGSMSGLANVLSRDRRWDAINYVRTLQTQPVGAEADNEATVDEEADGQPDPLPDEAPADATASPLTPSSDPSSPIPAEVSRLTAEENDVSPANSPPTVECGP